MTTAAALAARARGMQQSTQARAEDLAWMAETGETLTGAAKRLGITLETLERWCARHGQMDSWRRLAAHENAPAYHPNAACRRRRAS